MFLISLVSADHALPSDLVTEDTTLMEGMGNWANDVTNGVYWFFMLLGFCMVLFISTIGRFGTDKAFGYAGITALFGSISLLIIGWISWIYASMMIITGVLAIAFMVKSR